MVISKIPLGYQITFMTPEEENAISYLMDALKFHCENSHSDCHPFTWEKEIKSRQEGSRQASVGAEGEC